MTGEKSSSKSKKRKYPFSEDGEEGDTSTNQSGPSSSKRAKIPDTTSRSGHFVSSSSALDNGKMDLDDNGIEKLPTEFTPDEKKEIAEMLDDIEERKRKKREKRAARKTNPPAPTRADPVAESSIEYLKSWHSDRENWKFKTAREAWLIRNWRDLKLISDDVFDILVSYFESIRGGRRELLRKEAKRFTKKFKKEVDDYKAARNGSDPYAVQYRRAKAIRKALRNEEDD